MREATSYYVRLREVQCATTGAGMPCHVRPAIKAERAFKHSCKVEETGAVYSLIA